MLVAAATPHLPGVLHALEPTLNNYGYLAVAGLVLIEDFGVPVPGETVLILGAVYAGSGRLSIILVVLLGFLGAVVELRLGVVSGSHDRIMTCWRDGESPCAPSRSNRAIPPFCATISPLCVTVPAGVTSRVVTGK